MDNKEQECLYYYPALRAPLLKQKGTWAPDAAGSRGRNFIPTLGASADSGCHTTPFAEGEPSVLSVISV